MDSSSQEPPPPKSPRRRRKHSRNKKGSAARKNSNTKSSMAISEPLSPSSPFSWRLERRKSSSPSKRSHGIAPSRFHAKLEETTTTTTADENDEDNKSSSERRKQPPVPAWKEGIERNILIQEQIAHTGKLEAKRKEFRKKTQLKTWPLQDMALEHLDHLLGIDASRQFHGGDYLSAESSSSVSSAETSKPRLAPKSKPATPPYGNTADKSDKTSNSESKENNENNVDTKERNSTADEDSQKGIDEHQPQHLSLLWSLEPRIFATEKGQGKRKYLVGEFGRIADWYWRKTAPASRHLYEVIREGSPCRLYFDLEFSKAHNPSVPEVKLLQELEEELTTELQLHYGKFLPRLESSQIVNLDSSNEKKFSRHWVVHLLDDGDTSGKENGLKTRQEFLFKDAPTVGRFIKRMVGRLADDIAAEGGDFAKKRPTLAKHLFVNTKDQAKKSCFIDLGVYTRNRLFRCLGSSKKGKASTLKVVLRENVEEADQRKVEIDGKDGNGECDIGGERCYYPLIIPDKKEIELSQSPSSNTPSMETFIAGNDWTPHAQALADSLVVPLKNPTSLAYSSSVSTKSTSNRILEIEEGSCGSGSIANSTDASRKQSQSRYPPSTSMARQGSPMPSLDQYVTANLAGRGGVQGSIRAWSIERGHHDTPVSFTYHVQKNRFCEMIGRSHKSNNVFWTIDLNNWTCIQGCWDPECFGRGSPIPISNTSMTGQQGGQLSKIQHEFESWQEEEFEKALGELNLDDIVAGNGDESSSVSQLQPNNNNNEETQLAEDLDDLSDEALLQAIVDNPELFP